MRLETANGKDAGLLKELKKIERWDGRPSALPQESECMYYKLYNPDPKAMVLNILDTNLTVYAHDFAVVSEEVARVAQSLYSHLEVTESSTEEYKKYRARKAPEPIMGIAPKQPDLKKHQEILKQHLADVESQKQRDIARAKKEEELAIAALADTTVRQVSPNNCPAALEPQPVEEVKGKKALKK